MTQLDHECTHTTLFGFDNLNNRTPIAISVMKMSNFHSAEVKFTPPDGIGLRPDVYPFDTSALRSSASEYPCPTGNLGALGAGAPRGVGEGGLRARTFAAILVQLTEYARC